MRPSAIIPDCGPTDGLLPEGNPPLSSPSICGLVELIRTHHVQTQYLKQPNLVATVWHSNVPCGVFIREEHQLAYKESFSSQGTLCVRTDMNCRYSCAHPTNTKYKYYRDLKWKTLLHSATRGQKPHINKAWLEHTTLPRATVFVIFPQFDKKPETHRQRDNMLHKTTQEDGRLKKKPRRLARK